MALLVIPGHGQCAANFAFQDADGAVNGTPGPAPAVLGALLVVTGLAAGRGLRRRST